MDRQTGVCHLPYRNDGQTDRRVTPALQDRRTGMCHLPYRRDRQTDKHVSPALWRQQTDGQTGVCQLPYRNDGQTDGQACVTCPMGMMDRQTDRSVSTAL